LYGVPTQARLGKLEELRDRAASTDGARSITHAHISKAIACVSPPDAATAAVFCDFMASMAWYAGGSGCTTILEAGAIPVIFDCLRSWPDDKMVVKQSCDALAKLLRNISAAVKQAMRDVPDCEALLREAQMTGFDKDWNKDSLAAEVLRKFGWYVYCVAL
jgi:hypothetical protein